MARFQLKEPGHSVLDQPSITLLFLYTTQVISEQKIHIPTYLNRFDRITLATQLHEIQQRLYLVRDYIVINVQN